MEKSSINMVKNKIALENRTAQSAVQQDTAAEQQQAQSAAATTPGQPAVQLSGAQIEEAKQLAASKMKIYRKDRLYTNDKEKIECLNELLKSVRITDEASYFANPKPQAQQ